LADLIIENLLVLIKHIVFQIFRPILTIFIKILKTKRSILFSLFFYLNVILQIVHSKIFLNVQGPKKLATDNFPPIVFCFLVCKALTTENKMCDSTKGDGELEQQSAGGDGGSGQADLKPKPETKNVQKSQSERLLPVDIANKSTKKRDGKEGIDTKVSFYGQKVTSRVALSVLRLRKCRPKSAARRKCSHDPLWRLGANRHLENPL